MKRDKEWLKQKLNTEKYYRGTNEMKDKTTYGELYDRGISDGINVALEFIEQLDEPEVKQLDKKIKELDSYNDELIRDNNQLRNELDNQEVLSQEWIGEHRWNNRYIGRPFVYVDDLQNLLVPKQDKPVIPQFVADYIERAKPRHDSLYQAMEERAGEEVNEWVQAFYNSDKFARAWLDGYEVEKEKRYYIVEKINNSTLMTFELSDVVGEEVIEFVYGYSENETIHFNSKEKAELIAHFVGESLEVEEVKE